MKNRKGSPVHSCAPGCYCTGKATRSDMYGSIGLETDILHGVHTLGGTEMSHKLAVSTLYVVAASDIADRMAADCIHRHIPEFWLLLEASSSQSTVVGRNPPFGAWSTGAAAVVVAVVAAVVVAGMHFQNTVQLACCARMNWQDAGAWHYRRCMCLMGNRFGSSVAVQFAVREQRPQTWAANFQLLWWMMMTFLVSLA